MKLSVEILRSWCCNGRRWLTLASLVVISVEVSRAQRSMEGPVENLRVPLEQHPNGQVKTQLFAARARVLETGDIEATEVRIEFYNGDGTPSGRVLAGDCRYSRSAARALSESEVRLEREGLVITGKGFEWSGEEQTVTIKSEVKVVLPRNLRPVALSALGEKKE